MKYIDNNIIIKKNIILFFISALLICLFSTFFYLNESNKYNKELKKHENTVEKLNFKKKLLENEINKKEYEADGSSLLYKSLEKLDKSFYYFKEKNKFITDFNLMIKKIEGIEINKIEYSKSDTQKQMKITIPFLGNYRSIRNLIYEIENNFYFLKIEGLNITVDNDKLRGNIEIRAYFGDDKIEKE